MANAGKLIVIEGGDASGKETQTKLLAERLREAGHTVHLLDFPQYDENQIGHLIRECLDGKRGDFMQTDPRVASVLYAADRFETKAKIEEWLAEGAIVLLDRYTSANMLHQGAKIADAAERSATINWIYRLEHDLFGLPVPDLVVYLALPAAERARLRMADHINDDRDIDVAEIDLIHQTAVDDRAPSILGAYQHMYTVDCLVDGVIRNQEEIADEIENQLRDIL